MVCWRAQIGGLVQRLSGSPGSMYSTVRLALNLDQVYISGHLLTAVLAADCRALLNTGFSGFISLACWTPFACPRMPMNSFPKCLFLVGRKALEYYSLSLPLIPHHILSPTSSYPPPSIPHHLLPPTSYLPTSYPPPPPTPTSSYPPHLLFPPLLSPTASKKGKEYLLGAGFFC